MQQKQQHAHTTKINDMTRQHALRLTNKCPNLLLLQARHGAYIICLYIVRDFPDSL
jgi:hypothetical protein